MLQHPIVSRDTWLKCRRALLDKVRVLSPQQDVVNRSRQCLPWVQIERGYNENCLRLDPMDWVYRRDEYAGVTAEAGGCV